jgi:uncharacterized membrane protein YtjA (UPF0391 family)
MLRLALMFLLIAIFAGVLGLSGVAWMSMEFARILFFLFLVLFIISLISGLAWGRPPPV